MLRIKIALLGLILNVSAISICNAQNDSARQGITPYITVAAGISTSPEFIFEPSANISWNDYVIPGYSFSASSGVPVWRRGKLALGVTAMFGYYSNGFNFTKYLSYLASTDNNQASFKKSQAGAFTQYSYLAGFYGAYAVGKTVIELKVTGGIGAIVLPNSSYYVIYSPPVNYSILSTQTYSSQIGYSFDGGIQINYPLGKNMSATFDGDFLYYSCKYTNIVYEGNNPTGKSNPPGTAMMQMMNGLLGLTYTFGK